MNTNFAALRGERLLYSFQHADPRHRRMAQVGAESSQLEFDLEKELPPLTCRPQLLTAAFSTLLSNALDGLDPVSSEAVGLAVRPRAAATGTNSAKSAPK